MGGELVAVEESGREGQRDLELGWQRGQSGKAEERTSRTIKNPNSIESTKYAFVTASGRSLYLELATKLGGTRKT